MHEANGPPSRRRSSSSGFRGVSNPLTPLQTAGNSASFSGRAAPKYDPAPLRRPQPQRHRHVPLMSAGYRDAGGCRTARFHTHIYVQKSLIVSTTLRQSVGCISFINRYSLNVLKTHSTKNRIFLSCSCYIF